MLRTTLTGLAVLLAAACGNPSGDARPAKQTPPAKKAAPAAKAADDGADAEFAKVAERFFREHQQAQPLFAVGLGFHEHDGKLPDLSAEGLKAEVARLKRAEAELTALSGLSDRAEVERQTLLTEIRGDLFDLEVVRAPWRSPRAYVGPLGLTRYIVRDYGPAADRATAIIKTANAAPALLEHAKQNLEEVMPRPWLETGIRQIGGMIGFVRDDVPKAFPDLDDAQKDQLGKALETMAKALEDYRKFLEGRTAKASDEYALGEAKFLAMLEQTQGVKIDLARLEQVANADLERNLKAMAEAAKQIDASKPVEAVVAQVMADKPAPDAVLAEATAQGERAKKFLVDKDLVTIPTDDVAEVRETPPFRRYNLASLSSPGPFEKKALPAIYYITPPDPSWPKAQQQEYVPGKTFLLFVTIHEVWPGHFLHMLHKKRNDSKILKSFGNYAMTEGWAHYTEEMMWDEGWSEDPADRIGQLIQALMRNVRFVSAIGLHAKGMTVDASEQLFREKAFLDPGNARQQAVRGTFDPMYLSYTLGKLMIMKLRDDVRAKREAEGKTFSLKEFHDEFLSYGAAPVPAIRRAMLGPDAGPAL